MLRFLADENLKHAIVDGLRRRNRHIDIITVQESGLVGTLDPQLLAIATEQRRVLLSHDVNTLPGFLIQRIAAGLPSPALVVIPEHASLRAALDDLDLLAQTMTLEELAGTIIYIPL